MKNTDLTRTDAEEIAIQVLVFLSSDEKRFQHYRSITGLEPESIRQAAADRNFLASVLDYLMQDEALLLQFCELNGHDPSGMPIANRLLGGSAPTYSQQTE